MLWGVRGAHTKTVNFRRRFNRQADCRASCKSFVLWRDIQWGCQSVSFQNVICTSSDGQSRIRGLRRWLPSEVYSPVPDVWGAGCQATCASCLLQQWHHRDTERHRSVGLPRSTFRNSVSLRRNCLISLFFCIGIHRKCTIHALRYSLHLRKYTMRIGRIFLRNMS